MITLSDFNVGDVVYVLNDRHDFFTETEVKKVGRRYVTLTNGKRFTEQSAFEFCLADNYEYGERHYLFKTVDDYNKHLKKKEAISQFRDFVSRYRLEKVPYEKLKGALRVLKGGEG